MDKEQWWYFTFGYGNAGAGHYVKFFGTYETARNKMIEKYGWKWAFQYPEDRRKEWEDRCKREGMEWLLETELK